jgi:phosphatidylserine/phosphatidylglycerophosphate/cardiolipin synthase-like enzyme
MTISVLPDNTKTWNLYKKLIIDANKRILLVLWYVFQDDPYINKIEEILTKKLLQGVDVTIVYTNNYAQKVEMYLGGEEEGITKTTDFARRMGKLGAHMIDFSLEDNTRGTHRKALVVDDNKCILGSRNMHKFYYWNPETHAQAHLECDLYIDDPKIASDIARVLSKSIISSETQIDPDTQFIQFIPITKLDPVGDLYPNIIEKKYIELIDTAKDSIILVNNTAMFRDGIKSALVRALKRDITVNIFTNSTKQISLEADPLDLFFQKLMSYDNFMLYENVSTHLLHAKYGIFDHQTICIGSFNFDDWSYSKNAEILLVRQDKDLALDLWSNTHSIHDRYFRQVTNFGYGSILQKLGLYLISVLIWLGSYIGF